MDLCLVDAPMGPRERGAIAQHSIPIPTARTGPKELRTVHQHMARYAALGKSPSEVAMLTGYSIGYVRLLQDDPAFAELVAGFKDGVELEFQENVKLKAQLNRTAMEIVQAKLTETPEAFANKDLILLIKETSEQVPVGGNVPPPAPTQIQVNFFSKTPQARALPGTAPLILDMEPANG